MAEVRACVLCGDRRPERVWGAETTPRQNLVNDWRGVPGPLCLNCRAMLGMELLITGPRRGRRGDRQWAAACRRWLTAEVQRRRSIAGGG